MSPQVLVELFFSFSKSPDPIRLRFSAVNSGEQNKVIGSANLARLFGAFLILQFLLCEILPEQHL
jgi:hypothetical protein